MAFAKVGGHIDVRLSRPSIGKSAPRPSDYSGYWVDETTVDFIVEGAGRAWRTTQVLPGKGYTVGQTQICWTKGLRVSVVSPSALAAEDRFTHFAVAVVFAVVAFMWHRHREEG